MKTIGEFKTGLINKLDKLILEHENLMEETEDEVAQKEIKLEIEMYTLFKEMVEEEHE